MIRIFIITILFLVSLHGNAQATMFGYNLGEIKKELSEYKQETLKTDEGIDYLVVNMKTTIMMYFLDDSLICTHVIIMPKNTELLNLYIQKFNNEKNVVSSTAWNRYECGVIINYELQSLSNGRMYFLVTTTDI